METTIAKLRDDYITVSREIENGIDEINKDIIAESCDVGLIVSNINHVRTLLAKYRAISKEYAPQLKANKRQQGELA